jgi:ssDNA-binding Zn-finger/Zn-ribbon topoisomerase 1
MVERASARGPFLGCSGYPRCRHTMPMPAEGVEYVTPPEEPNGA